MTRNRLLLALLFVLSLVLLGGPAAGTDETTLPEQKKGGGKKDLDQKQKDVPLDRIAELVSIRPGTEFRIVASRYDSDRGSLERFYNIASSPTRIARLKQYNKQWLAALEKLNTDKLSQTAKTELAQLQKKVEGNQRQVDTQAKQLEEIAPLIPFAFTICELFEARQRGDELDHVKAATALDRMTREMERIRKAGTLRATKDRAARAADTLTSFKTTLKSWYNFYKDYDPAFSWWMAMPHKEVDQALSTYATFLRDRVGTADEKALASQPAPDAGIWKLLKVPSHQNDVPDLQELLSHPRSEMTAVSQRYQSDRGGVSKKGTAPGGKGAVTPEGREKMKKLSNDWLAALKKIDFDNLSRDGQVDYLLLRNNIEQEIRRIDFQASPPQEKIGKMRDESGITGRPIGRAEMMLDLAGEMVAYTPEELLAVAESEYKWCEAEMIKASREMGFGDDWRKAVEKVKTLHVPAGKQPVLIHDLAHDAIDYLRKHDLITIPYVASETWTMQMMSPKQQLSTPFFTGGAQITISYPTDTMSHDARMQSMRGNNIHFSMATVHHELIPGHNLQGFMSSRYGGRRAGTPFWGEGWALYWEFVLYSKGFAKTPENRVGFLFWRMHRCARIVFSFSFHLGKMSPQQCIDYLVTKVGHERDNATAEVRRSFGGGYGPLYQAAYMLGGLQLWGLRKEMVDTGKMTERAFHDRIIHGGSMPIEMVRVMVRSDMKFDRDYRPSWKFYGPNPGGK